MLVSYFKSLKFSSWIIWVSFFCFKFRWKYSPFKGKAGESGIFWKSTFILFSLHELFLPEFGQFRKFIFFAREILIPSAFLVWGTNSHWKKRHCESALRMASEGGKDPSGQWWDLPCRFRKPEGHFQAGHETLGEAHLCDLRRKDWWGELHCIQLQNLWVSRHLQGHFSGTWARQIWWLLRIEFSL